MDYTVLATDAVQAATATRSLAAGSDKALARMARTTCHVNLSYTVCFCVLKHRQLSNIPPFHMATQNWFSAFTWALKPVLKSI